jgi:glycosyltransferase involved in cell wall biosynthesis
VFPSRTDTFGLVVLEALASGLPVAAYPVPGPLDIVDDMGVGALNEDLGIAVGEAITVPRTRCRAHALKYSWAACAESFLENLHPLH